MALNFPNNPSNNQIYTDVTNGTQYLWNNAYSTWSKAFSPGQLVTISDTPPVTSSSGNIWYNSVNGETYIYYNDGDSQQWVSVTSTLTAAGYTGSIGYTGSSATGYIGSQGDTGYVGSQGYTGSSAPGFTGSQGDPGGYTGSAGFTGSAGIGYVGSQGDPGGYTGSQGNIGSTGFVGSQGPQGFTGYTGSTGSATVTILPASRNRIINGAMVIDQRYSGVSNNWFSNVYTVDRWGYRSTVNNQIITYGQNLGGAIGANALPKGFFNYVGFRTSNTYSTLNPQDYFTVYQNIEGFNVADLNWGTANAQNVYLSFWTLASIPGTYGGAILNGANTRSFPFQYTISPGNTWVRQIIFIPGDTTGTWFANNQTGIGVNFSLGAGSTYQSGSPGSWASANTTSVTGTTNIVSSNNAFFLLTGVQLEPAAFGNATPFEIRSIQEELARCQRYYYRTGGYNLGATINASDGYNSVMNFPVSMRLTPNLDPFTNSFYTVGSGSVGTVAISNATRNAGTIGSNNSVQLYNSAGNWTASVFFSVTAGFSAEL